MVPVVMNPPCNTVSHGFDPEFRIKISHAMEQLSLCATTAEAQGPRLERACATKTSMALLKTCQYAV